MPRLAVLSFPGNNCEIETVRAAERNGFEVELIRWNEADRLGSQDAYVLPGGFSFEDRGRSGVIASKTEVFDVLRSEAAKGKLILGICNGAQMVVESGLIPVAGKGLPFALAKNIRRDQDGNVLGTGFYNAWVHLKAQRTDTAFSHKITQVLHVPIAHGEGRFASIDETALSHLEDGSNVLFRYCDEAGAVSADFPVTPNGSAFATAAIVNDEGTVAAMMPHPERFFDHFDGDGVFASMCAWVKEKKSPASVQIGGQDEAKVAPKAYVPQKSAQTLEKRVIITDNEAFSIASASSRLAGEKVDLKRSILYEVVGEVSADQLVESGLLLNPNKEYVVEEENSNKFAVLERESDEATDLGAKLSEMYQKPISVQIYKVWDFGETSPAGVDKVLGSHLLANPNSAEMFSV